MRIVRGTQQLQSINQQSTKSINKAHKAVTLLYLLPCPRMLIGACNPMSRTKYLNNMKDSNILGVPENPPKQCPSDSTKQR